MLDRESAEALFLEHLGWIDRVALAICARGGIRGAEAEDFTASLRMMLLEDDYAVLRRFLGTSEFKTYLASVLSRHFVSYVRMHQGEWRSSAAAKRLGTPATDLERLVRRDGYTVHQAGEKLRTAGITALSDIELARLLGQLPERAPLRPEVPEPATGLDYARGDARADERVLAAETESRRAEVMEALNRALRELDPEERLIVRMHFGEGLTLADVARTLRLEQKPLYRRVDRLRNRLRVSLESAGLRQDEVRGLLSEESESP
jgi:RNA polymerase sigma factor for flagellar operon FliA